MDAKLVVTLWLAIAAVAGCKVPNADHCVHKAIDSNAWCADEHEDLAFCSPCQSDNNGCQKTEPTEKECPDYTAGPTSTTGTSGETGETGETGDPGSGTGTTGETSESSG